MQYIIYVHDENYFTTNKSINQVDLLAKQKEYYISYKLPSDRLSLFRRSVIVEGWALQREPFNYLLTV